MQGRRRITLYEQMSAVETGRSLAGLTLDDILANHKKGAAPTQPRQPTQRTLLDIIREDESNKKDRKTWKAFKDKLRLKRTGSAWTSSVHIPASDIPNPIQFNNTTNNSRAYPQVSSGNAVPLANSDTSTEHMDSRQVEDMDPTDPDSGPTSRPQFSRRVSSRYDPAGGDSSENKLKPSISRHNSTRMPAPTESTLRERGVTFRDTYDSGEGGSSSSDEEDLTGPSRKVRTLSAREAVAAQEASEAAAAAQAAAEAAAAAETAEPVRMSLMDLLEETDRQMGLEGSTYCMGDYDSDYDDEEEEEEEEEKGTVEHNCCVCMVRHKGAALIPCGHTFCRMCSRELWVSRGNCPLCNNFILEILDIF